MAVPYRLIPDRETTSSCAPSATTAKVAGVKPPEPFAGAYPFDAATSRGVIVLHSGAVTVHHAQRSVPTTGRIWLDLQRSLDIRWEVDTSLNLADLNDVDLELTRPGIGPVRLAAGTTRSGGAGYVRHVSMGDNEPIDHIFVHWFNLPGFLPADPLSTATGTYGGRWTFEAHGWRLTLDCRPDLTSAVETARQLGQDVHTHTGKLERTNGAFTAHEAQTVLEALQLALSFALGRWVPPALPVGLNSKGECVWEEWASYRCSPNETLLQWWDTMRADDLHDMCAAFLDHWFHPALQAPLRHAVMHAVSSSCDQTTTEARVMLAQAGIEYLAWVTNVLEGSAKRNNYERVYAEDKVAGMLTRAGIPPEIPPALQALSALAPADKQTGPKAITWLRNRLVHPKDAAEPYRIEGALWSCWLLSLGYLDLLVLHRLGYQGSYLPRLPGVWAHDSIPVPWAGTASDTSSTEPDLTT
jgi:hypothetical protein